jgi:hypothetical protein
LEEHEMRNRLLTLMDHLDAGITPIEAFCRHTP